MKIWHWLLIAALGILLLLAILNPLKIFMMKMKIEDQIGINVINDIPLTAKVTDEMVIKMLDKLNATISVTDRLTIDLNEDIDVPLKMNLTVPLETEIFMDEVLNLEFDLPIDVDLSPQELALQDLQIPFNQPLFIEDELAVDFSVTMDTKIETKVMGIKMKIPAKGEIPIKTTIPISQALHVKDTITLNPTDYNIRFNTIIPVSAQVPIKQMVNIKGELEVPVDQRVVIPLQKVINAPVLEKFDAVVEVKNAIPVGFESDLKATASFSDPLKVVMDELKIDPKNVTISSKKKEAKKNNE